MAQRDARGDVDSRHWHIGIVDLDRIYGLLLLWLIIAHFFTEYILDYDFCISTIFSVAASAHTLFYMVFSF